MTDFHGDQAKKILEKKNPKCQTEFFKIANSQKNFVKLLWIGLGLVELIDAKGIDVAQHMWP